MENQQDNLSYRGDPNVCLSPGMTQRKGFMHRTFGRVDGGSVRASMLGLICAAVGAGVLTMPNIFLRIGYIPGGILICCGATGCYWGLYMLTERARDHNLMNYSQLTLKAGGYTLEKILQFSILIYMYATCLACTIVVQTICCLIAINIFGYSVDVIGNPNGNEGGAPSLFKIIQTSVFSAFFLAPIGLNRLMGGFRQIGIASLASLIFTVCVVFV